MMKMPRFLFNSLISNLSEGVTSKLEGIGKRELCVRPNRLAAFTIYIHYLSTNCDCAPIKGVAGFTKERRIFGTMLEAQYFVSNMSNTEESLFSPLLEGMMTQLPRGY